MKSNIKFVSYKYDRYSLCHGMLTLKVNGKKMTFGGCLDDKMNYVEGEYPKFWLSGGGIHNDGDYCLYAVKGEWYFNNDVKLPDMIKDNMDEIMKLFNENVPQGCCGGCI